MRRYFSRAFVLSLLPFKKTGVTGTPSDCSFRSSIPSSAMARSATGFLFGFFDLPTSKRIPEEARILSFTKEENLGAGCTRIVIPPSHNNLSSEHNIKSASRRCSCLSLSIMEAIVYEDTSLSQDEYALTLAVHYIAAKEMPTLVGNSDVD